MAGTMIEVGNTLQEMGRAIRTAVKTHRRGGQGVGDSEAVVTGFDSSFALLWPLVLGTLHESRIWALVPVGRGGYFLKADHEPLLRMVLLPYPGHELVPCCAQSFRAPTFTGCDDPADG